MDPNELRELIVSSFNMNELISLLFRLKIDDDEIPGSDRETKVINLITYCERRRILESLMEVLHDLRPNVFYNIAVEENKNVELVGFSSDEMKSLLLILSNPKPSLKDFRLRILEFNDLAN